jgi:hypothetical protein
MASSGAEGDRGPQVGFAGRILTENPGGSVLVGEGLPDEAIAGCYLATLTAADLFDMARAAVLLAYGLRQSGIDPATLPPVAMRTADALLAARRMRPYNLRKALELMHAPPYMYDEFLRLCPGAIAPERA